MRTEKEKALDTYLAAAARTGDRQALDRLAQRWHPKLLAHAHRLTGERQLAADSTQEAWTDILRDLPSLDNAAAFPAWAQDVLGLPHRLAALRPLDPRPPAPPRRPGRTGA